MKFLTVTLFFALVVLKPVHDAFPEDAPRNRTHNTTAPAVMSFGSELRLELDLDLAVVKKRENQRYLWMYLVFAYLFTGLAVYLLVTETERIIAIRQTYLGNQATITDRTIRLSGIPPELRSEAKIKDFIEGLEIGKVDSVTLCRYWQELDSAVEERKSILRNLEESWTLYSKKRKNNETTQTLPVSQPPAPQPQHDEDEESGPLLRSSENGQADATLYPRSRPTATIRYGFLKLQSRYVDAIDFFEEKLRRIDEKILELRKGSFEPTPLAFVTMDNVASCVGAS